jgi:integrase
MAKVRARADTGMLYMDFFYRGVRCREQTALPDSAANRKTVQSFLNRIQKEMAQGSFDYAATFPSSVRAAKFARSNGALSTGAQTEGSSLAQPSTATPTFSEFSVTWRAEMAPQWRRMHRVSVDAIFTKHLLPAFGTRPVGEINKVDVLNFRAELAKLPGRGGKKLTAASINKVMCMLRQMLNEASERFEFALAFRGIKPLKMLRPEVQPFSLEEVERIRAKIRPDYRNYVTTRFFTGMRTGEINGLRWKYVDREHGLILVRETLVGGESEENAKTQQSLRDIPMLPIVREAIEDQWRRRDPDSPYVFGGPNLSPIDAHNFANRVWYPLLRYLELEKRRPYQTRHTTATLMLASGENPEWIARIMGHANTQMLFTVYSRFVPNLTRSDGLAITGLINSRDEPPVPAPKTTLTAADIESMDAKALRKVLKQIALETESANRNDTHGHP